MMEICIVLCILNDNIKILTFDLNGSKFSEYLKIFVRVMYSCMYFVLPIVQVSVNLNNTLPVVFVKDLGPHGEKNNDIEEGYSKSRF